MTQIINGKKISAEILAEIKKEVALLPMTPIFCDVLVGEDPASVQYVQMKKNVAENVGMKFHKAEFASSITTEELVAEIKKLNKVENMCGIIVQLPLPKGVDTKRVLAAIDPKLDVDNPSPAAAACLALLDSLNLSLQDKKIVVLGFGALVGQPVVKLLKDRNISPEIVTKETSNKEEIIKNADVIISGMGNGKYLKGEMLKSGVVLIDAGTAEQNGGVVGDVDFDSIQGKALYISPVPGGVGPVTVAMLFKNVLKVAKTKKHPILSPSPKGKDL